MIQDIKQFTAGVFSLHPLWQLWLLGMTIVNGILPFFFMPKLVAVVTLVGVFSAAVLGLMLVRLQGFTKLLGLMHLPWVPMLATQVGLYPGFDIGSNFSLWLTTSIVVTAISLVIDAVDVATYFRQSQLTGSSTNTQ